MQPAEQVGGGALQQRVNGQRRDFDERLQHEAPFVHARMRHYQIQVRFLNVDDFLAVQQQIQIDRPRPKAFAAHPAELRLDIQKNAQELGLSAFLRVVRMDVFKFMEQPAAGFDLIFAGPPYALETIDELPKRAVRLLNVDGWFILEHTPRNNYEGYPLYVTQRNYGTTIFSIFVNKKP